MGEGIKRALECGFERVISMEINPQFYNDIGRKFKVDSRVTLLLGDTEDLLPSVMASITERVVFWLDGHILTASSRFFGKHKVPLLQELAIIAKHPIKTHTILIDDRNLMSNEKRGWAEVSEDRVLAALKAINPDYQISYEDSVNGLGVIIVARMEGSW